MGASDHKPSLEEIALRIAKAFLRQRYPLSEAGLELWHDVNALVSSGSVPTRYIDILPTVENRRSDLFADLSLTPEQEARVFGWKLSCIQTHTGCTRQCEQCYKGAGHKLTMMPFAAIGKIAEKKLEYEKRAVREWIAWENYLCKQTGIDLGSFWLPDFLEMAKREQIVELAKIVLGCWKRFSPKVMKVAPFLESMSTRELRSHYLNSVPINYGSIHYQIFNYDDNEPLEYRDFLFLHQDGLPADYGDVFKLMSISLRPITVTTSGWFDDDAIACRAMKKVIEVCKAEPGLNSRKHRVSFSFGERHARADINRYITDMERMLEEAAPIQPMLNLYYDEGDDLHRFLIFKLGDHFDELMTKLGIEGEQRTLCTPLSFGYGRAVGLREEGKGYNDYDPDRNIDGIHIRPNGEVCCKPDAEWGMRINKRGGKEYYLWAPEGSIAEPTGMWLYKLNGGEN